MEPPSVPLDKLQVVWAAPTNRWPEKLWIYRALPQEIPASVVANLLALGSLDEKHRHKSPTFLQALDKSAVYYSTPDESKYLAVCARLGFLEYRDKEAEAPMSVPVEGVPSEGDLLPLALAYLRLAGVDRSQLASKGNGTGFLLSGERTTRSRRDKASGTVLDEVDSRGLLFTRCIDGVRSDRAGDIEVNLGNHGRVATLRVLWRRLEAYELCSCLTPEGVVAWIRSGKAKIPRTAGEATNITTLAIVNAEPVYESRAYDEEQRFVCPYLLLDAVATSGSASPAFRMACPILKGETRQLDPVHAR
jgi:hypothetical protein